MAESSARTNAIRSLLLPLDGSRLAEAVLPAASGLARALGLPIVLLHVLELDPPNTIHGDRHLADKASAERYLIDIASRLEANGLVTQIHVHDNPERDVPASIVQHMNELDSDLVVLAKHGSGGIRGFLYGRVAQQVLLRGDSPVLMIPVTSPLSEESSFKCDKVAVFLDGTSEGESALPLAVEIAQSNQAELLLIRVIPTLSTLRGERAAAATLVPGTTRTLLDFEADHAVEYLATLEDGLTETGLSITSSVVRGDTASSAVAEALRLSVDLVAMATHGRVGLDGIWNGSVGMKVIGQLELPMLLVKSPG